MKVQQSVVQCMETCGGAPDILSRHTPIYKYQCLSHSGSLDMHKAAGQCGSISTRFLLWFHDQVLRTPVQEAARGDPNVEFKSWSCDDVLSCLGSTITTRSFFFIIIYNWYNYKYNCCHHCHHIEGNVFPLLLFLFIEFWIKKCTQIWSHINKWTV